MFNTNHFPKSILLYPSIKTLNSSKILITVLKIKDVDVNGSLQLDRNLFSLYKNIYIEINFKIYLIQGLIYMVRSYEELIQELRNDYELNKDDIIYDLSEVFPELIEQLYKSNITYLDIYDILRKSPYSLDVTYQKLSDYYNFNLKEDWLLDYLKNWLKRELISTNLVSKVKVYKKINYTYPNENTGVEMDVVGVGIRNRKSNGSSYLIYAIEAKTSNASFYRSARQVLGYPLFVNKKFFACYFDPTEDYTPQQRAYALQRDFYLLKVTSNGNPTENSTYFINTVDRRGGKDIYLSENNFGDDIWNEIDGRKIKGR